MADDYPTLNALLTVHGADLPPDAIAGLRTLRADPWQIVHLFEGVSAHSGLVQVDWWPSPTGSVVCRVVVAPIMPASLQAAQMLASPETMPRQFASGLRWFVGLVLVIGLVIVTVVWTLLRWLW